MSTVIHEGQYATLPNGIRLHYEVLGRANATPVLILTARGTGYLFQRIVEAVAPEAL